MRELVHVNEEKNIVTVVLNDYQEDLFDILASNSYDPLIDKIELVNIVSRLYKFNGPLVGKATCHENDTFNYEYGYELASKRADRQFFGVVKQGLQLLIKRSKRIAELYEDALEDINNASELSKCDPARITESLEEDK